MKTVGELKRLIKDLPDDMPLVTYQNNMEKVGYQNEVSCAVVSMKEETREAWDRFDGCGYTYKTMVRSKDGSDCLMIN